MSETSQSETPYPPSAVTASAGPVASTPFVATRWTLVLRAQGESPEARAALGELCEAYYQPVLRFLRREGRDEESARELAQEFFARVLAGHAFTAADPERGRFRSYLLGALKHFLADQRKHQLRQKRGGDVPHESMDSPGAAGSGQDGPGESMGEGLAGTTPGPASSFDREWALAVMARALDALAGGMNAEGKAKQFETLNPWLMGEGPTLSQADAAKALQVTEGAVKVMIHRLRKRFRDAVRSEIGQTLRDPALVDEELRHLIEALS
jgi:RNA polymerase sigma-70 factor (ECF subfamily)